MCLAIPGQIVEVHADGTDLATIDVSGVRRRVNIGLLEGQDVRPGDWVLIHVGFAMNKIGEEQAKEQMRMIAILGEHTAAIEEVKGYGLDDPPASADANASANANANADAHADADRPPGAGR